MSASIWLLPQGVNEILPNEAAVLEALRRAILDELQTRNFELVFPPMIEFLDNLIQGAGSELTTQTFKVPDYDSHKTLGIRADMTPQIAQIDAHRLGKNAINKLCYIGTVLRTKPMTLGGSRELLQIGAEIFGDNSINADKSIVEAMLAVHQLALNSQSPSTPVTLSLSHVGIFSALITALQIDTAFSNQIYDALLRKSTPDIRALDAQSDHDLSAFIVLSQARGGQAVLSSFRENADVKRLLEKQTAMAEKIDTAIAELEELADFVQEQNQVNLHIDLSELHGYRYHSGLTFQTFIEGEGKAIAKGGRYHGFSESTQTPRPATGFSADLKLLASKAA